MRWLTAWWRWFWFQPTSPFNLGVCRILCFGGLGLLELFDPVERWAAVDPSFWRPQPLFQALGWTMASAGTLSLLMLGFRTALLLACVGLGTRGATLVAFGLGTYLLGLAENTGKLAHNKTIVVLVLGILACARCGDALSIDRWLRDRLRPRAPELPATSWEYTWPIRLVWVLMALAFTAAGLGKLWVSGLAWATSDNLRNLLIRHQYSHTPPLALGVWIARWPLLCHALAVGTLVLEAGSPLALVSRRLRVPWILGLMGMQLGIGLLMGIKFLHYAPCYVFWFPWDRWLGGSTRIEPVPERDTVPAGTLLAAGEPR